ncbi:MAG: type IV pilus secretin PilQ [Deltaproteobacteria bacterium]|jgi:type IV pilus assembly protein PilQ|nr:type IV pilus secretin PilQ [Deltaproteobacteria bacterium]
MNCGNYKLSKIRAAAIFLVILIAVFTGCAQNMAAKKDMGISPEPKLITEISTSEDSESFNVLVKGNRVLTYMSVKQIFPLAVMLYFPETALDNIKTKISPESEIVGSITASELNEKGHKSKIEILLKKDVPYKAANEETGLKISFSRPSKALSSPISSSSEPVEKPVEKMEEKAKKPAWVNRIDFSSDEAGKSTIIIGTTRPVEYRIKKASPQLLQLKLLNTRLPDYRKFPLITTRFESAVDRIIPVQTPAMKNTSMLTIELRETVPYFIEQNNDLLLVHFEASSIAPRPLEDAKLPAWKKVLTQTVTKEEIETKIDIDKETPEGLFAEKYTGEKIALDFYETDIKNVFRILQEVSAKNFAIDKDVAGKVTLTLDKPVPWDQVLDLVLKMNQLSKVFEGDIIRIATAETLKKEEVQYKDLLKAREEKKALEPLITEYISVNYANAQEDILPKIESILTENRGSASADQRTNTIIMTDIPEKIKKAREIINNLDKVTPQVIIEARIVEATTNFSREIGTQWGAASGEQPSSAMDIAATGGNWFIDDGTEPYTSARGALENTIGVGNTYGGNIAMNVPIASSAMSLGFNFTKIAGTPFLLNAKLLAMESQGEGKIISAPKIVTLDNKKAIIKQGLRYPYKVLDEETGIPTTKFEDIDLVLEVMPHVTPDDRISMQIKIIKNDLGPLYGTDRSFTTKEANTELLVNDGDTVVIGGIIKTTKSSGETGVPWLSKIPFLGWLFKSTEKTDDKEELLIFITPTIVKLEQRSLEN